MVTPQAALASRKVGKAVHVEKAGPHALIQRIVGRRRLPPMCEAWTDESCSHPYLVTRGLATSLRVAIPLGNA